MDPVEQLILSSYQQRESGSYYDLIQKVKPNYQNFGLRERGTSENVITSEGVVRRRGKSLRLRHRL